MFSITPEAFDAVDVSSSLGPAGIFSDDNMVPSDRQRTIGMPVIGIVQTSGPGVLSHKADELLSASSLDREDPDQTVSLEDAKDDDFSGCRALSK